MEIMGSVALAFFLALSQTSPDQPLSFDAASVKPDDMSVTRMYRAACLGGPGSRFGDQFICTDATVGIMTMAAFDIQPFQLFGAKPDSGPRFEVRAVIPKGATRQQVRVMFQNLLKERFHFAYHFEKREMSVFELVRIGNGPGLRPSSPDDAATGAGAMKGKIGPPLSRGNSSVLNSITGVICFEANGLPLSELTSFLSRRLERQVTDNTGLTGKFEYSLSFKDDLAGDIGVAPGSVVPSPAGIEPDAPSLATALKEQLGLKLVAGKAFVDVLVIDHFDKVPTAN